MVANDDAHRPSRDHLKYIFVGVSALTLGLAGAFYVARKKLVPPPTLASTTLATAKSPARLLGRHVNPTAEGPIPNANIINRRIADEIDAAAPALYTAGAFGLATALVCAGACAGVYSVHRATGANNVEEFAVYARGVVRKRFPELVKRLYPHLDDSLDSGHQPSSTPEELDRKLEAAYEKGGIYLLATTIKDEANSSARVSAATSAQEPSRQ